MATSHLYISFNLDSGGVPDGKNTPCSSQGRAIYILQMIRTRLVALQPTYRLLWYDNCDIIDVQVRGIHC